MFDITKRLKDLDMTREDLAEEIAKREWYHQFDFSGITTPGYDPTPIKLGALGLPEDMTGKSVLDVGTCEGFFAFECEQRGAKVLATDSEIWKAKNRQIKSNFLFVKDLLNSQIKYKTISVEELSPKSVGTFDVVLFLGVLYHSTDPLGYLRKLWPLTREVMILETFVDLLQVQVPAAAFYPGAMLCGDPTNYWGPNRLAVEALCMEAGFKKVELKAMWDQNTREKVDHDFKAAAGPVTNGRMVFHVYP